MKYCLKIKVQNSDLFKHNQEQTCWQIFKFTNGQILKNYERWVSKSTVYPRMNVRSLFQPDDQSPLNSNTKEYTRTLRKRQFPLSDKEDESISNTFNIKFTVYRFTLPRFTGDEPSPPIHRLAIFVCAYFTTYALIDLPWNSIYRAWTVSPDMCPS